MKFILGLTKPVIGLAPMDGVSDSPFREIMMKYGKPDIMYTEFTNVKGLLLAAERVLHHFHYVESEKERPLIAQIYGSDPIDFYHAAKIPVALGYDGVDINMGCPAKNVANSGSGAALIKTPDIAAEIIYETKRGVADFLSDGKLTGMKQKQQKFVEGVIEQIRDRITREDLQAWLVNKKIETFGYLQVLDTRHLKLLDSLGNNDDFKINDKFAALKTYIQYKTGLEAYVPVSVKTRIGFDEAITEKWISHVAKQDVAWIGIHGRTLNQMYKGAADYNELKIAVESTDLPVLVNGDIRDREHALERIEETGAFGALIGRGAMGNPWVFSATPPRRPLPRGGSTSAPLKGRSGGVTLKKNRGGVQNNHYNINLKTYARENRKKQTPGEALLWSKLRGKQLLGLRFLRQRPIDRYIADFFQPDFGLVIEVDGMSHNEYTFEYDQKREKRLVELGYRVIRFSEFDVKTRTDEVLQSIVNELEILDNPKTENLILEVMLEHAKIFNELHDGREKAFVQMRKHFGWYTKTLQDCLNQQKELKSENPPTVRSSPKELRIRLMKVRTFDELLKVIDEY